MNLRNLIRSVAVALCLMPLTALAHNYGNGRASAAGDKRTEKEILRLEEVGRQKVLRGDSNWDDLIAEGAYMIAYDGSIIIYRVSERTGVKPPAK